MVTRAPTSTERSSHDPRASRLSEIGQLLEENGTLVVVLAMFATLMVVDLHHELAADGWMALLSGRAIAQHGLPSHDFITVWAHGRRWTDQQWLAQLALYELFRLGGIKLVMLIHAVLASSALVVVALVARRFGASARSVTWVCVPVLVSYFQGASVMRPQTLTFILFALILWLLSRDQTLPSRRTLLVIPILVLWANLHGSVVLAAAVVSGYGLLKTIPSFYRRDRPRAAQLTLALAPWASVFASPYVLHLPSYYRVVLFSGGFGSYVSEWAPTTLSITSIPLFLLIFGGIWLLGRHGERLTPFEKLLFLGTAVLAFQAVRNDVWFSLVCVLVLPKLVDALRPSVIEPQRLNRLLATAMLVGLVISFAGVAANRESWFLDDYPAAAATAAAKAAGSNGRVFANETYADWLVWTHPELTGRIAFDSRFELLTQDQLKRVADFRNRVGNWRATPRGYDVLVLDPQSERSVWHALAESGSKVISKRPHVVVLTSPSAASTH